MTFVKPYFVDDEGYEAPQQSLLEVKGGLIFPGVVQISGIASCRHSIAIINCTSEDVHLKRGIPFSTAHSIRDTDVLYIEAEGSKPIQITSPQVYILMTISSMHVEEIDSKPDNLHEALEYDPAENLVKDVKYDQDSFERLMGLLKKDQWDLIRKQWDQAEKILYNG